MPKINRVVTMPWSVQLVNANLSQQRETSTTNLIPSENFSIIESNSPDFFLLASAANDFATSVVFLAIEPRNFLTPLPKEKRDSYQDQRQRSEISFCKQLTNKLKCFTFKQKKPSIKSKWINWTVGLYHRGKGRHEKSPNEKSPQLKHRKKRCWKAHCRHRA